MSAFTADNVNEARSLFEGMDLLADMALPFGPFPGALDDLTATRDDRAQSVLERVAALIENANLCARKDPLTAATCLHEAGRLLDRRLRMPASAWECHSRALACASDFRPALSSLRRIARTLADEPLLARVLDAQSDGVSEGLEAFAVMSERAALALRSGDPSTAARVLEGAVDKAPENLVAHLLRLLSAASIGDTELTKSLDRAAAAWPRTDLSQVASLIAALVDERGGRLEEALVRLAKCAPTGREAEVRLARGRLLARLHRTSEAIEDLAAVAATDDLGTIGIGLRRLMAAAGLLDSGATETADGASREPHWDLALLGALRRWDLGAEAAAADSGGKKVADLGLQFALQMERAAAEGPESDKETAERFASRGATAWHRAIDLFLGAEERYDDHRLSALAHTDPAGALVASLNLGDAAATDAAIGELAPRGEPLAWDIAVARAAVRLRGMNDPRAALEILRECGAAASRAPLASLVRMHDRSPRSLADVAIAEAGEADTPKKRASLLAWAATHLEGVDADEAASLHREALSIEPTCALSLAALERRGTDHQAMADALVAAARSKGSIPEAAGVFVRAGIRYMLACDHDRALHAMLEALRIAPGDRSVRRCASRLARGRLARVDDLLLDLGTGEEASPAWEILQTGALALDGDPDRAARLFAEALANRPDDPVASAAFTLAALRGDRRSEESSRLISMAREARDARQEALVHLRLADVDGRWGSDRFAAVLSLVSVVEKLPGHRSTLGRLIVHYARQGRPEELSRMLAALGASTTDDTDAWAMADEALRARPFDLDLLRLAARRDPSSAYTTARLEATSDDEAERLRCLESLAEMVGGQIVYLSRLADRLEDDGRTAEALALRRRALAGRPDSLFDLLGVERLERERADMAGLEQALIALSDATTLSEYRIERLLEASRIALDELSDPARSARSCLEVLRLDPANDEAFARGKAILEESADLVMLDRFLSARIQGIADPRGRLRLFGELAQVRVKKGERPQAREALALAIEIAPTDVALRRWMAALFREDAMWEQAAEHLMEAARNAHDPAIGMEVFFDLGALYMDHLERLDLAEKSFVKVLSWNREHFPAMERLSVLYERLGNWGRCAQALEHLARLATDLALKVEKTVLLARVLETRLSREKDAEAVVLEMRRAAPEDVRPVEYLAGMYTRQGDAMALNVLLDQALATHSAALTTRLAEPVLYANIHSILSMKAEDATASMAAAAIGLLGVPVESMIQSPPVEARWNVGARIGLPAVESYLFPKALPPGLRETMKAVEEPMARLLGLTSKQMGLGKETRLDKRHPLVAAITAMASSFGVREELGVFIADANEVRIAPGSPHSVIVPRAVATSEDEAIAGFVAAFALTVVRSGLSMATLLDNARLSGIIAATVRLCVPSFAPRGMDQKAIERDAAMLRPAIPAKVLAMIQPFAFDCSAALEGADLKESVLAIGNRAGFLGAGSLTGAIAAMIAVHLGPRGSLADLPGIGRLMSFVFSKDHLELRKRLGL